MKKFQTWLVGIALSGILVSTVSFASFTGGGSGGLSLPDIITGLTGIFAKLDITNTFTASNEIQVDGVGPREGLNITKDGAERSAICHSRDPANGGQSRSWCWESTNFISRIVGNSNNIFGTSTSSTIIQTYDYNGGGRVNMTPTGAMGVASGNSGDFNTTVEFSVGGTSDTTNTFLVDAVNDWTKQLPIAAPAATECDDAAEKGRLYFDSTANTYKHCDGSGWKEMSDTGVSAGSYTSANITVNSEGRITAASDGAFTGLTDTPANYTGSGGKALKVNSAANAVEFVDVGTATVKEYFYELSQGASVTYYTDSFVDLNYDAADDLDINVGTLPSGGFYSHSCRSYNTQDETTENTTGVKEIWGALSSGVHVDCVVSANTDTAWPSYYLTAYNTGTGDNVTISLRVVSN